jgi:asparagine synthase (glutamine-hydrolysing)
MMKSLAHGGPDGEGIYIDDHVGFGHRRLAIIDLSDAGRQPMLLDDGQLIISFNGEIYNFKKIKCELERLGRIFHTKTDTEVLLAAYREWGAESFDRLEGIFAFSLYDKKRNKIFLVRDHLGVKPLYYHITNELLLFASEVKAFKAYHREWQVNSDWQVLFLAFGSIPHPHTTLHDVYQLPAGSYLELDLADFKKNIHQYYEPKRNIEFITDRHRFLRSIRNGIKESVEKNLISDAPLGVFLSGGIDSSLLALTADAIQDNVTTISVNFTEEPFDERPYQRMVLDRGRHIRHISKVLTEDIFWDQLDDIWSAMDQPSIDGVNSYFVSKFAKLYGLKVVLSGLGADEIFGGYESFNRVRLLKFLQRLPFKRRTAKILQVWNKRWKRLMFLNLKGMVGDYLFLRGIHTPDSIALLLQVPEEKVWEILRRVELRPIMSIDRNEYASFLESNVYMANQLLKDTDYMSMWHGVEVRVPFLDVELIRRVQEVKPSLRFMKGWPKYLLTASCDNLLPHEIIFRHKKGFTFPFAMWIRNHMDKFERLLPSSPEAGKVLKAFKKGTTHWSACWSLAVVKQFK